MPVPEASRGQVYWPEIDGLRMVAVLSVIVFHLERRALPGGFVGVDVFFVISGFLITGHLLKDLDRDRFSLLVFYQRRVARIAPALFLVLAATLVATPFVYSAQDIASAGSSAAFAALSIVNLKYMLQGNYFDVSRDSQPLLHYWSLSVEEQFYLLFPLMLMFASGIRGGRLALILGGGVLSFALYVALTHLAQTFAFYLLPTRAWELLLGATVAVLHSRGHAVVGGAAALASFGGLALICGTIVFMSEGPHFPGAPAVAPAAGAALFLAAVGNAAGTADRIFSNPMLVFVGRRSYSLYLWHWPIFSIIDYACYQGDPALRMAAKVGATTIAALLTYRFVEVPMRQILNAAAKRHFAFLFLFAGTAAIAGAGVAMYGYFYPVASPSSIKDGGIVVNGGLGPGVVLIGDSQAAMYAHELASIARDRGVRLHILAFPAGNQLPGQVGTVWADVLSFVRAVPPDVAILAQAWETKLESDGASLRDAIAALCPYVGRIVVMAQPPRPPQGATREAIRGGSRGPFLEAPDVVRARSAANARVRTLAAQMGAEVIETETVFSAPDGGVLVTGPDGGYLFQDAAHLSSFGARLVRPALEKAMARELTSAGWKPALRGVPASCSHRAGRTPGRKEHR